jgi:hypothetical protein
VIPQLVDAAITPPLGPAVLAYTTGLDRPKPRSWLRLTIRTGLVALVSLCAIIVFDISVPPSHPRFTSRKTLDLS